MLEVPARPPAGSQSAIASNSKWDPAASSSRAVSSLWPLPGTASCQDAVPGVRDLPVMRASLAFTQFNLALLIAAPCLGRSPCNRRDNRQAGTHDGASWESGGIDAAFAYLPVKPSRGGAMYPCVPTPFRAPSHPSSRTRGPPVLLRSSIMAPGGTMRPFRLVSGDASHPGQHGVGRPHPGRRTRPLPLRIGLFNWRARRSVGRLRCAWPPP